MKSTRCPNRYWYIQLYIYKQLKLKDTDIYKDFHMAQCTDPTPLAYTITFRCFSLHSTNFSVILKNIMCYSFYAKQSLDGPMDLCRFENAKCYVLKFHSKVCFSLILKDQKLEMCFRNTFFIFQTSVEIRL